MKTIFTLFRTIEKTMLLVAFILLFTFQQTFAQQKHIIEVSNNKFTPNEITIEVGDTIEWKNLEGTHNVNGTQETFPANPETFGNDVGTGWIYSHVFTIEGNYDYRCDPHFAFGMTGTIEVLSKNEDIHTLTVSFSGMSPHVGQDLWLGVIEKSSGTEIGSVNVTVEESFEVEISGIEKGMSYNVDFFADHNNNGEYDAPPTDHAWRLSLENVTGDTTLSFTHNTNFTNIFVTTSSALEYLTNLKLYPNPAQNQVTLEFNNYQDATPIITLYDVTGRIKHVYNNRSLNHINLNINKLTKGIYFIEVKLDSNTNVLKLLKE